MLAESWDIAEYLDREFLRAWIDRGFDLYGGLGRDPRMKTLFE